MIKSQYKNLCENNDTLPHGPCLPAQQVCGTIDECAGLGSWQYFRLVGHAQAMFVAADSFVTASPSFTYCRPSSIQQKMNEQMAQTLYVCTIILFIIVPQPVTVYEFYSYPFKLQNKQPEAPLVPLSVCNPLTACGPNDDLVHMGGVVSLRMALAQPRCAIAYGTNLGTMPECCWDR